MNISFLKFNKVSFGYENSINDLFQDISFQISYGWTSVNGVNGSGKTTLLKLACGLFKEFNGTIEAPITSFYNEQRTDNSPNNFSDFLNSYDKYAFRLIDGLGIQNEWIERWKTLSHGERKRAQLACALWLKPDLLAIDEPTNHLDSNAKKMIVEALKSYKGIGLIVSHDRELMENLCSQSLFVEPPQVTLYKGNISEIIAQQNIKNDYALKQLALKNIEINKAKKEFQRRTSLADKNKKKSSKKHINKNDHDAKSKIDLGRLTGKDATAVKLKKRMSNKLENIKKELSNISVKREYETGITLSDSVSKRNYLLNMQNSYLELSKNKKLIYRDLLIEPTDKIALTGSNGSGKSSLLKIILKNINADQENITYIPQEISIEETKNIIQEIKTLSKKDLGELMIIISRLGSDAKRVLDTEIPSPGETRKLLLGLGITKNPHIIIMDEPTNHMDLVSIECLEAALKEVKCAILLVSHDIKFLEALTKTKWHIIEREKTYYLE